MVKFPEEPKLFASMQVQVFEDGDVFVSGVKSSKFSEEELAKAFCIALVMVALRPLTKTNLISEVSERWDEAKQEEEISKEERLWDIPEA